MGAHGEEHRFTAPQTLALDHWLEFSQRIVGCALYGLDESHLDFIADALEPRDRERLHGIQHMLHRFCSGRSLLERVLEGRAGRETDVVPEPIGAVVNSTVAAAGVRPEDSGAIVVRVTTALSRWIAGPAPRPRRATVIAARRLTVRVLGPPLTSPALSPDEVTFIDHCSSFMEKLARLSDALRRSLLVTELVDEPAARAEVMDVKPGELSDLVREAHHVLRAPAPAEAREPAGSAASSLHADFRWIADRMFSEYT